MQRGASVTETLSSSSRARAALARDGAARPGAHHPPGGGAGPQAAPTIISSSTRVDGPAEPGPITSRAHPSTWKQPRVKVPYLPGLDGLRAVAVMAVLMYHGEVAGWQGGFLGVEVFFVISGYLITSILLAQWQNDRRIDLKTFYKRRALRLLPALFLVLFLAALLSVIFLPKEVATLRGDIVSALTYVTNWFYIIGQKSYFESSGRPSLVQHLWSLAVEEQFYLIWPLLFTLGMRRLGPRRLCVATVVGAGLSTALMAALYHPGVDPSRVYYGTDTRAGGLLIGAAVAFIWAPFRLHKDVGKGAPILLDIVGGVAFATLVVMLMVTDQFSDALYRGGFAKVSLVTVVVIAVVVHPAAHLGRIIGWRPFRWVGLRSYGLYLYHRPIYQLTRPGLDVALSGAPLLTLRLGLTFAVATASYKYIETPIRDGSFRRALSAFGERPALERRRLARRWGAGAAAGVLVVVFTVSGVVRAEQPPPEFVLAGATTGELPPGPADGASTDAGARPPAPAAALGTTSGNESGPGDAGSVTAGSTAPGAASSVPGDGATTTTAAPPITGADGQPVTTVAPPTDPATDPATVPARHINAIGDSVMLGAANALKGSLNGETFVDAKVGRQVSECLAILHVWHDNGLLGDVVVVHIGNNGTFSEEQFAEMRDILSAVPKVIFINNKVPRMWEDPNNQVIAAGAATMPNAVLIDWKAEGDAHPEFFYSDGMHLKPDGAAYYAGLINAQL